MAVLKSGVHATIAGVVLGFTTPVIAYRSHADFAHSASGLLDRFRSAMSRGNSDESEAILGEMEQLTSDTEPAVERLERLIHPWVSYVVLPLFALANAGIIVSLTDLRQSLSHPVTIGVILGLVVGKFAGIVAFTFAAVKVRLATLPANLSRSHVCGVAALAGIGFTVSLFISDLAFENEVLISNSKVGILLASSVAAICGYTWLRISHRTAVPSSAS